MELDAAVPAKHFADQRAGLDIRGGKEVGGAVADCSCVCAAPVAPDAAGWLARCSRWSESMAKMAL